MPFDPAKPAVGSPDSSAEMRAQLNALNDKIDAIPAGPPEPQGDPGADGADGAEGPQGPPFADAIVDAVNTLDPGEAASVDVSFDGTNVHFTIAIPRGADGAPGEVSAEQLDTAIADVTANSSSNANGIGLLGLTVSDPPTQAEMQTIADKLDELVGALRR